MAKVLFLNPPDFRGALFMRDGRCTIRSSFWSTLWPPVTLAYGAAMARRAGWQARILDAPSALVDVRGTLGRVADFAPDLVVAAVSTPSFEGDMEVLRRIEAVRPDTRIAVIGVHASATDAQTLTTHPWIDFVLRGETEATVEALCRALDAGGGLEALEGLTWRDGDAITRNPDRPYIDDLDTLPLPAWDLLPLDDYRLPFKRRRFLNLVPHRGCPYECTFCTAPAHYGHRLRRRSVDSLIAEIRHNRAAHGVDDHFLWADTFTLHRPFVMESCAALRANVPGTRWTCNSRLDTVDEEMLTAMAAAGCWMMSFGIESADAAVLERMKKNVRMRGDDPYAAVRAARRAGIRTVAHFILGMPGESEDTIRRTIETARSLPLDFAQFYAAAPFVGSALYDEARRSGWIRASTPLVSLEQDRVSMNLPGLPAERVERLRRTAVRRFYLRPSAALRLVRLAGFGLFGQLVRESLRRLRARRAGQSIGDSAADTIGARSTTTAS